MHYPDIDHDVELRALLEDPAWQTWAAVGLDWIERNEPHKDLSDLKILCRGCSLIECDTTAVLMDEFLYLINLGKAKLLMDKVEPVDGLYAKSFKRLA